MKGDQSKKRSKIHEITSLPLVSFAMSRHPPLIATPTRLGSMKSALPTQLDALVNKRGMTAFMWAVCQEVPP